MSTENLIIILLIFILLVILISIGIIAYFGHRYLRLKELEKQQNQNGHSIVANIDQLQLKSINTPIDEVSSSICIDHPEELALNKCAISAEAYCEKCIIKHDETWVAKKNLDILLSAQWHELFCIKDSENFQSTKERLMKVKASLWKNATVPILIQGHFKIDVEDDKIQSFIVIKARTEDIEFVKKELSFIN